MDELKKDEHKTDHTQTPGKSEVNPGTNHSKDDDKKKSEDAK